MILVGKIDTHTLNANPGRARVCDVHMHKLG